MKFNIDYFKALNNYNYDVYELPEAIKVHVSSSSGKQHDFYIKFIH